MYHSGNSSRRSISIEAIGDQHDLGCLDRGRDVQPAWNVVEHERQANVMRSVGAVLAPHNAAAPLAGSLRSSAAMRVVGLTGGIACGKSTVSAGLRRHGLLVIDCDELAHEVCRAVR